MILVNTDYIAGQELEMLGLVKGSTIQSKNIGRDITQGFKTLVGGELGAYTDMMNDARALATKRMGGGGGASGCGRRGQRPLRLRRRDAGCAEVMAYGHCCKVQITLPGKAQAPPQDISSWGGAFCWGPCP